MDDKERVSHKENGLLRQAFPECHTKTLKKLVEEISANDLKTLAIDDLMKCL
ncbi:MAG: hypothetical protein R3B95_17930 [Nitrospirales bacterium]|nr:hypothetical protein [Nitrospirales bacterium]